MKDVWEAAAALNSKMLIDDKKTKTTFLVGPQSRRVGAAGCERDVAAAVQRPDHVLLKSLQSHLLPPGLRFVSAHGSSQFVPHRRQRTSVTSTSAAQQRHIKTAQRPAGLSGELA